VQKINLKKPDAVESTSSIRVFSFEQRIVMSATRVPEYKTKRIGKLGLHVSNFTSFDGYLNRSKVDRFVNLFAGTR